jgi:hypothetical protein
MQCTIHTRLMDHLDEVDVDMMGAHLEQDGDQTLAALLAQNPQPSDTQMLNMLASNSTSTGLHVHGAPALPAFPTPAFPAPAFPTPAFPAPPIIQPVPPAMVPMLPGVTGTNTIPAPVFGQMDFASIYTAFQTGAQMQAHAGNQATVHGLMADIQKLRAELADVKSKLAAAVRDSSPAPAAPESPASPDVPAAGYVPAPPRALPAAKPVNALPVQPEVPPKSAGHEAMVAYVRSLYTYLEALELCDVLGNAEASALFWEVSANYMKLKEQYGL